ncbi:MAG: LPS export ABC transporter periplasmic protein LptC [Candidatus Puniceispirillaceae bacterium]
MSDSQGSDSRPRFSPRVTEIDTQNPSQPRSVRAKRNRLVLVASLVVIGIGTLGWTNFLSEDKTIEISLQTVSKTKSSALEMTGARYAGTTQTGKQYVITADRAVEKEAGSGEISLFEASGVITDRASQQTRMNARQATYQSASSIMRLSGDVVIYQTANDMTLKTQYAEADIENGLFEVPENVTIQSPRMSLVADSMTSRDKGQYYLFGGQSKLVLKPKQAQTQ